MGRGCWALLTPPEGFPLAAAAAPQAGRSSRTAWKQLSASNVGYLEDHYPSSLLTRLLTSGVCFARLSRPLVQLSSALTGLHCPCPHLPSHTGVPGSPPMQVIRASSQGQLLEGPAIPLHFGHFRVKGGGRQRQTSLLGVAGRPGSFPRQGPVTRSQSQRKGTAQVSHLDHQ